MLVTESSAGLGSQGSEVPISAEGVPESAKQAHGIWFLRKWESYTSAPGKHYFSNKTLFLGNRHSPQGHK